MMGAPKCGTTALRQYLIEHPAAFVTEPRQPHYFANDLPGLRTVTTQAEYLDLFSNAASQHAIAVEASTMYLYSSAAARNIKEFDPDARLIVLIRNPIKLAQALHAHLVYYHLEDVLDFETAWRLQETRAAGDRLPPVDEPQLARYRDIAMLGAQLERLLAVFPEEQILVLERSQLGTEPAATYATVLSFLDLPDDGRSDFDANLGVKQVRNRTVGRFVSRPPTRMRRTAASVKRLLGHPDLSLLRPLRRANTMYGTPEPLRSEFRTELIQVFRDDISLLATITGRDLSAWLAPTEVRPSE